MSEVSPLKNFEPEITEQNSTGDNSLKEMTSPTKDFKFSATPNFEDM